MPSKNQKFENMRDMPLLLVALHLFVLLVFAQAEVESLLTENISDSIGIDVQKPGFSRQLGRSGKEFACSF